MQKIYDVAIIGAGVVGSAIARELSRYQLSCALLEANPDVGMGTSKANTAIWHTGFDAKPASLESKLLQRSYKLLEEYIPEAGIPMERLGGMLIAWTDKQLESLPALLNQAHQNGVMDVQYISVSDIYNLEPNLKSGALGGLYVPGESIFCTFTLPLALATQAVLNDVSLHLNFPVKHITSEADGITISKGDGERLRCRYLINAAGLYSDKIDRLMGHNDFTITPRRGELIVYDKFARSLLNHIILPVPTKNSKGVLISPTVYGNILLGPTSEAIEDKTNTATSEKGLKMIMEKGESILPSLMQNEITATYAGLRAATEYSDYQIHLHVKQKYICVGGIRSTGISASLGIAEYVRELLAEAGLSFINKQNFKSIKMPYIGASKMRPYQNADMITKDSDYGEIVCHCEQVTLGEIRDALRSPIPAQTVEGLRRRTRAMQGRCQGFNCQGAVVDTLARGTNQDAHKLLALEINNEN